MVVSKVSQKEADDKAMKLADIFWGRRKEFGSYNETRTPEDTLKATKESIKEGVYPVVISASGNISTAGSSSGVTTSLQLILKDD
jgi:hypothetical protein